MKRFLEDKMPTTLKKKKWQEKSNMLISSGKLKERLNCCFIEALKVPKDLTTLSWLDNCQSCYLKIKNDMCLYYIDKTKTPISLEKIESEYSIDKVTQGLPTHRPLALQNELSHISYLTGHKRKSDIYLQVGDEDEPPVILPFNEENALIFSEFSGAPEYVSYKLNEAFKIAWENRAHLEIQPNSNDRKQLLKFFKGHIAGLKEGLFILERYGHKTAKLCEFSYWFGNFEDKDFYTLINDLKSNLDDLQRKVSHGMLMLIPTGKIKSLEKEVCKIKEEIKSNETEVERIASNQYSMSNTTILQEMIGLEKASLKEKERELEYWKSCRNDEIKIKNNQGDKPLEVFIFMFANIYEELFKKAPTVTTDPYNDNDPIKGKFVEYFLNCKKILDEKNLFCKLSLKARSEAQLKIYIKDVLRKWRDLRRS